MVVKDKRIDTKGCRIGNLIIIGNAAVHRYKECHAIRMGLVNHHSGKAIWLITFRQLVGDLEAQPFIFLVQQHSAGNAVNIAVADNPDFFLLLDSLLHPLNKYLHIIKVVRIVEEGQLVLHEELDVGGFLNTPTCQNRGCNNIQPELFVQTAHNLCRNPFLFPRHIYQPYFLISHSLSSSSPEAPRRAISEPDSTVRSLPPEKMTAYRIM